MSSRSASKRRGRPPKTPSNDRSVSGGSQSTGKFQYNLLKKPKYLLNRGCDSQLSTPTASRASSPHDSNDSAAVRASSSRPSSSRPSNASRVSAALGSSRKSRASATPSGKRGKVAQSATPYSKKEYMYGSDFGDSSDDVDADDDMLASQSESESLIGDAESESDFSLSSFSSCTQQPKRQRQPTPDPIWLQQRDVPELELPVTSDDLLIPLKYTLRTTAVYEIMRRFKYLMRLTPFRLEDLCAALVCVDQSSLLIEVHIALMKAILREEDSQSTHFAPIDQKDSVNISLYLVDQLTWPEILRSYVESDPHNDRTVLDILSNTDYPYTSVDNRLTVLQFLTDQFLVTAAVREDICKEGPIHYDDHCRICHRLGDLLCCETCPAVFHLECVDPPLVDVPTEDWQCSICKSQQISGVYDCMSAQEKQGLLCRQASLGVDRHGRKYWFIARRLFVEADDGNEIWYYSTVAQLEQLLTRLDDGELERELCLAIGECKDEIVRHMDITERLTEELKGNKQSYLELENAKIRDFLKQAIEGGSVADDDADAEMTDAPASDSKSIDGDKLDVEGDSDSSTHTTRLKTGSLVKRTYGDSTAGNGQTGAAASTAVQKVTAGATLFRLGMDGNYKTYSNRYTTSPIALNKPQRNEERDKKRHLSHKFSLTTASEFRWTGPALTGSQHSMVAALRSTLLSLEQMISSTFMHPNWMLVRKQWVSAVTSCSRPLEFAKVIVILFTCFKPALFSTVWHEQLGHIRLQRITAADREEKKKLEKREKREKEEEEERNRLSVNFVKYSLGLKHQVWKQKGEEYRIHGQWGWVWMSYGRRRLPGKPSVAQGERINTHKVMVPIERDGVRKIIGVRASTHEYLRECRAKLAVDATTTVGIPDDVRQAALVETVSAFAELDVSKALAAPGRLLYPKQAKKSKLDDMLANRVALRDAEELKMQAASKADATASAADGPAAGDAAAKPANAKVLLLPPAKIYSQTSIEKQLAKMLAARQVSAAVGAANPALAGIDMDFVNALAKSIQAARQQFGALNRFGKQSRCYGKDCLNPSNTTLSLPQSAVPTCYSPLCLQKSRVKRELLTLLRKAHTAGHGSKETVTAIMAIVNRKPTVQEQKALTEKAVGEVPQRPDDVAKMQKDFREACAISFDYEDEDINDCISMTATVDEPMLVKQESDEIPELIAEDQEMKSEQEPDAAATTTADVQRTDEPTNNGDTLNVESVDASDAPVVKRPRISSEPMQSDEDEALDDSSSRSLRRKSSRNVRSTRSLTTTTTTTTSRTTTEYDDGSVEEESNSSTRMRSRELASDGKRSVSVHTKIESVGQTKYVAHVNRRFASVKAVKREEHTQTVREYGANGAERVYTVSRSAGRIYLRKTLPDPALPKPHVQANKLPVISTYVSRRNTRSLMVLPRHEAQRLARCGGRVPMAGFHPLAKNNNGSWPYPSSRPQFKTAWFYRTMTLRTLSAVALQMRIAWCCLRWDDMHMKPPTSDGKHQVTTETEIMSLEILKYRHCGRFSERTQYLRRKVVIPLELPKTIREFTSIRSGLRKRKRAESPQKTDPQVSEEWVDEDKLELWEIKQFGEKQERVAAMQVTRTSTGKLPVVRSSAASAVSDGPNGTNSIQKVVVSSKATPEEIKEKMEQQLRIQRAAHHQKRALEMKNVTARPAIAAGSPNPVGQRKIVVRNADGTTKVLQSASSAQPPQPSTASPGAPSQKVQIIRGPDGKVSVRGLNPGQQLIQMPDGKLHVLTTNQANVALASGQAKNIARSGASSPIVGGPKNAVRTPATAAVGASKQIIIRNSGDSNAATGQQQRVVVTSGQQIAKAGAVVSVARSPVIAKAVVTNAKGQVLQKVVQASASNLQNLLTQNAAGVAASPSAGTQKIIVGGPSTANRIVVAGKPVLAGSNVARPIAQQNADQQQVRQLVGNPNQKIMQQYVNETNMPQEVIINGQSIMLSPGQRIITHQAAPPVAPAQPIQAHIVQQAKSPLVQQQQVQPQSPQPQSPQPAAAARTAQNTSNLVINNSSLAQQLAQGKLQVANVNGQQVIIKPLGNNQAQIVAHVKTHVDGQAHIITSNASAAAAASDAPEMAPEPVAAKQPEAPAQQQPQQQQPQSSSLNIGSDMEHQLLSGQPKGTVIKCVTAQVIQTQQGPRIVLQGLTGNDFTPQQLGIVQQQVKQQLLKAQETSGKSGVLAPTKIYLAVQPAQSISVLQTVSQPPPLAPVQSPQQQTQPTTAAKTQPKVVNVVKTTPTATVVEPSATEPQTNGIASSAPASASAPATPTPNAADATVASPASETLKRTPAASKTKPDGGQPDSFVVTPDYIQQTIKNALKQENLNPEIEEKLLNLQRYQEKQHVVTGVADAEHSPAARPASGVRKRPNQRSQLDDDDWVQDTPKRRSAATDVTTSTPSKSTETSPAGQQPVNKRSLAAKKRESDKKRAALAAQMELMRELAAEKAAADARATADEDDNDSANDSTDALNHSATANAGPAINTSPSSSIAAASAAAKAAAAAAAAATSPVKRPKLSTVTRKLPTDSPTNSGTAAASAPVADAPPVAAEMPPVAAEAVPPAETLTSEAANAVAATPSTDVAPHSAERSPPNKSAESLASVTPAPAVPVAEPRNALTPANPGKRRPVPTLKAAATTMKHGQHGKGDSAAGTSPRATAQPRTRGQQQRPAGSSGPKGSLSRKKEKLFCVCRTPYDASKFYVGCDLCNNWFHGACVGLSEAASKKLAEFVCSECKHARDTQELYCLCRKPYDESQFYICCDKCQDWFHGRCVGIVQSEADSIDEYICPKCQQNNAVNFANMKNLTQLEYEHLRKMIKQIQAHKSAWPFMEPVDAQEEPDYYTVIKEPMDLQRIEKKINAQDYVKLSEFIGDMTKVFDNCRAYNSKESQFYRCAESLEGYFVRRIKMFRDTLATGTPTADSEPNSAATQSSA